MVEKGINVTVIMPYDAIFNAKFKQREPNVSLINVALARNISLVQDVKSLVKILQVIHRIKPDIVHLHTPKASFLGGLASKLLFKKNVIYHMHGLVSIEGHNVNKGLMFYIEKITCSLATKIFAVSESLRVVAVANNYCPPKKISVIKNGTINGIDYLNKFNPKIIEKDKEKLNGLVTKKFIIGFAGRLLEAKGIKDYIKVLANFKNRNISFMGLVIGPDESGDEFNSLLKENNLIVDDDIILLGQQLNPEEYMIYFDVLLLPTKREGFGLVSAEANALEIPVVGYDIPGLRDAVLNGKTGTLVAYGNSKKLFEAVLNYYNNKELRINHGINGRERVISDFKSEDIWIALFNEYQNLVKKS
tara:strand:- start:10 stop:1092 length:1083 start_codon:yes stop_codon:yes gene_type:complete